MRKQGSGDVITENDVEGWQKGFPKYENGDDYVYAFFDTTENSGQVYNTVSNGCFYQCEGD